MSSFTYPDGSTLTSTALTDDQIQAAFQVATAQMLGILTAPLNPALVPILPPPLAAEYESNPPAPWTVTLTLVNGRFNAAASSLVNLYAGQLLTGTGIPAGTVVAGFMGSAVILSNAATASGAILVTVTDPQAFYKVRIGWQQQGQPAFGIQEDICMVRCTPVDSDFGRMRDITGEAGSTTITQTDIYTRAWRTYWTFYGPNGVDRARAVRSALIKIDFVANLLATCNLYVNPSIADPTRVPENFQSQWWERVDLVAMFNEQITETYVVNADASVEVKVYTKDGELLDFTAQLP